MLTTLGFVTEAGIIILAAHVFTIKILFAHLHLRDDTIYRQFNVYIPPALQSDTYFFFGVLTYIIAINSALLCFNSQKLCFQLK